MPDAPDSRPRISDPYTGEDLGPAERIPGELERSAEMDTGYERTTPNPVYRGLPAATLRIDANGEIVRVDVVRKADLSEREKRRLIREQLKRQGYRKGKRKGPGDAPPAPKPEVPQVVDLMAALKASLLGPPADPDPGALSDRARGDTMQTPAAIAHGPALPSALTRSPVPARSQAPVEALAGTGNYALTRRGNNRMTAEATPATKAGKAPVTLYDLSQGIAGVAEWIDEHQEEIIAAGGDLDAVPGLVEQLEALEGAFDHKVERVALFIQNRSALEGVRRGEAVRFARLADADKRVIESLKTYLVRCQRIAGRLKVETPHVRSSIQRNSQQSVDRDPKAEPLGELHERALGRLLDEGDAKTNDGVARCIEVIPQPTLYGLNRTAVLEVWKKAYDAAKLAIQLEASTAFDPDFNCPTHFAGGDPSCAACRSKQPDRDTNEYEIDRQAQERANADPVLAALGVKVSQGFHVRLR